jgi:hypothetical protein
MKEQELTEEELSQIAELESEREAEFCMGFVSGGGRSSDWREAYRQSQMTEEEFGAFLEAQFGEELEAEYGG